MAIVDAEGRLFGRWNIIDVVLAVFLVGLVPLAYGAYALFRTPLPRLSGIEPSSLVSGQTMRVKVVGENFRPYMRVSFGTIQGISFLFGSTREAEVEVAKLAPGVYDVVLYDFQQERSRLKGALTVLRSPLPDSLVQVVGTFGRLKPDEVKNVRAGMLLPGVGEVLRVGQPSPDLARVFAGTATLEIPIEKTMRVPVVLRIGCDIPVPQNTPMCMGQGITMQAKAIVELATEFGKMLFQIDQVIGSQPLTSLRVQVRFGGLREALDQVKIGDVDLGIEMNELAAGARIIGVAALAPGQRDVDMVVQAQRISSGWSYSAAPLRIGGPFSLRTTTYELSGTVVGIAASPDREQKAR